MTTENERPQQSFGAKDLLLKRLDQLKEDISKSAEILTVSRQRSVVDTPEMKQAIDSHLNQGHTTNPLWHGGSAVFYALGGAVVLRVWIVGGLLLVIAFLLQREGLKRQ